MGKYTKIFKKHLEGVGDSTRILIHIADELAESNRLKKFDMIRRERMIIEDPYSEDDDIEVAKKMLRDLEDEK